MRYCFTILSLIILNLKLFAQPEPVIYQDSLGNKIDLIKHLSIRNTGLYDIVEEKNETNIRTLKLIKRPQKVYDSLAQLTAQKIIQKERIGSPIENFEIEDINGKVYKSEDLKGKIIVGNFWFVGCFYCLVEAPELNELYEKYKSNDQIVFISFAKSPEKQVRKHLKKKEFNYPVAILDDALEEQFKVESYPSNFVVNTAGNYEFFSIGVGPGSVGLIERAIEKALSE